MRHFEDTLELTFWRSAWHTVVFGLFVCVLFGTLHVLSLFTSLRLAGWLACGTLGLYVDDAS